MTTITEQSSPVTATFLSDIPITSLAPINGQALVYNSTANQFQYQTIGPTSAQLFQRIADPGSGEQEIVYNALGGAAATDNLLIGPQTTAGANTKMMFVNNSAQHGAFRAGTVSGTQWDLANCGINSFSSGFDNTSSAVRSVTFGQSNTVSSVGSYANGDLGSITLGSGTNNAILMGTSNTISSLNGSNNAIVCGNTNRMGNGVLTANSVICGGTNNECQSTNNTICGGQANIITTSTNASILGSSCTITGSNNSMCLGTGAVCSAAANSLCYSDGTAATNTVANSIRVVASGGSKWYSNALQTAGSEMLPGGGWTIISDVNLKENLEELDYQTVLQTLIDAIPIYRYNLKSNSREQVCMGPTAQDWHAAFPSSKDKLTIEMVDLDGVALAAIKGLARVVTKELDDIKLDIKKIKAHLSLV